MADPVRNRMTLSAVVVVLSIIAIAWAISANESTPEVGEAHNRAHASSGDRTEAIGDSRPLDPEESDDRPHSDDEATTTAELQVRVVRTDKGDGNASLEIRSSGPFGIEDLASPGDTQSFEIDRMARRDDGWEATQKGLPPGFWSVRVSADCENGDAARVVELAAGESQSITLYVGQGAMATWLPTVRIAGRTLSSFEALYVGPSVEELEEATLWHDAGAQGAPINLMAGEYTFWLPMLRPVTVNLQPGERRRDTFDLPFRWVEFSISPELAGILSKNEKVRLELEPRGHFLAAEHLVHRISELFDDQARNPDAFSPAETIHLPMPIGDYRWSLRGDFDVQGRLSVSDKTSSVYFDLFDMPGLATLDIRWDGGAAKVAPTDHYNQRIGIRSAAISGVSGPAIVFEHEPPYEDRVYVVPIDDNHAVAFARPGRQQLEIGREVKGEWRSTAVGVKFPGRINLSAAELDVEEPQVRFVRDLREFTYTVTAIHETGVVRQTHRDAMQLPPGSVRLEVVRSEQLTQADTNTYSFDYAFAVHEAEVTDAALTVDLDELNYQPFGIADIVFRGARERLLGEWTFNESEIPEPRVYYLDHDIHGHPRRALLSHPKFEYRNGLQAAIRDRALPPGRYRLEPWNGAPEGLHETFAIHPGKRTKVVVELGD